MKIINRKIKDLKPSEYNPRKISEKEKVDLLNSLQKFGFVDAVIVNKNPERNDVVVGGHQRLKIWESLGNDEVPTIEVNLSLENEKELNIRLNKNGGQFDYNILKEHFNFDELIDFGFKNNEIEGIYKQIETAFEEIENDEPEYKITPSFSESYNTVMIFCNNELDYNWLKNFLGIERKKCYKTQRIGECKVLTVQEFQKIIDEKA